MRKFVYLALRLNFVPCWGPPCSPFAAPCARSCLPVGRVAAPNGGGTAHQYSTVFALSSGHGKCGVAVIRITGENAKESILKMTSAKRLPEPRKSVLRRIIDPCSGESLDKGLVIWFPAPRSFTGEDCAELHIHGGPAVCKAVLSSLGRLPDFTPAQPGDFTKRAFYNGKLDLTSIEGLGDLIHAETEAQRKQAFRQMEGSLKSIYMSWKDIIIKTRANIEAYIDFSEDENIEEGVLLEVRRSLEGLVKEIGSHLSDSRKGERLRSGLNVVILGRPNVGKSSFLNTLVQRPAAIVSPIAGTTRDVIQVSLDLGGYPVNISDTAGLRPTTTDIIEKEGILRALSEVKSADMSVVIVDASEVVKVMESENTLINFKEFLNNYLVDVGVTSSVSCFDETHFEWLRSSSFLVLINKIDLVEPNEKRKLLEQLTSENRVIFTSLKTMEGLERTLNRMKLLCEYMCGSISQAESPFLTSQRQRTHIEECLKHLVVILGDAAPGILEEEVENGMENGYRNLLSQEETLVLAAQRLQLASNQLGYVTGLITTEDVLDKIFSSFCIGK